MYNIIRQGDTDQYNIIECMVNNRSDVANLPIIYAPGSSCIVIEDSSVWMLNTNKEWCEI